MTSSPSDLHGLADYWNWSYVHLAGGLELLNNAGKNMCRKLVGWHGPNMLRSSAYQTLG
eukprot:CAMPEP_0177781344 /NCGR_PEP_ID=MMETSP0491_2-20121128/17784_1 /TAXON_ID=63592 /ORGANISM="Tetraselmis chuii, Strain PLY429" /LENGTH=58 /DNA_ID=CAMNT_0019301371 /DNA_START=25 /DNA_END=197 /DNA_ORIENTATION=+